MTAAWKKHPLLLGTLVLAVLLVLAAWAARVFLTGRIIQAALREAGATDVRFQVTQVSPWRVVVEDFGLLLRLQPLSAGRVTLERAHWWMSSLGTLRVEEAVVPVKVEELLQGPAPGAVQTPAGPIDVPFDEISIDGQLVIQAEGQPDQALTMTIGARPSGEGIWSGQAQVNGPGLMLEGEGRYDSTDGGLQFKVPALALDVKPWEGFVRRLVPMPGGDWEWEGKLSGRAEGRLSGDTFMASGHLKLKEGRVASVAKAIVADGIEAELEFTDFKRMTTKPGSLRIREIRTGELTLGDVAAEFSLEGSDRIVVTRAGLRALGGLVTAEPFVLVPGEAVLEAVLLADGISIEEVMALTEDLPAEASGRVNGRLPVRIDEDGLRFGTGWLALKPGFPAEIAFNTKGLLTGGVAPGSPRHAVLQKIESGLLKLRIGELRLDIRPPNVPAGRSAQLHLKGEPVDPEVKAPVTLDLNVNGPLEKLINMGLDSRLSVGTKP
jgi:hypothetical protein